MSKLPSVSAPVTRTIADAKAHFAECIREAEAGRTIVLTRHGRAVARLVPASVGAEWVDESGATAGGVTSQPFEIAESGSRYRAEAPASSPVPAARRAALRSLLEERIWPEVPRELLARGVTKREREEILGYAASDVATAPKATSRDRR